MAKIQIEPRADITAHRVDVPPLSASVRRQLGKSLRTHYAASLVEPVSERLEALLAKLGAQKG